MLLSRPFSRKPPQGHPGNERSQRIGHRLRRPRPVQPKQRRQNQQAGDEEDELPREAQHHGGARPPDGLEEARRHDLETDDGEGGHRDAQGLRCQVGHRHIGGEQPHQQAGRESARRPSRQRHACADEDGPAQDVRRASVQPCPVVVADEGLDALVQPNDNHGDE